jgi:hypothetical protein
MTHPDKPGGSKESFLKMNTAYEIVKEYMKANGAKN